MDLIYPYIRSMSFLTKAARRFHKTNWPRLTAWHRNEDHPNEWGFQAIGYHGQHDSAERLLPDGNKRAVPLQIRFYSILLLHQTASLTLLRRLPPEIPEDRRELFPEAPFESRPRRIQPAVDFDKSTKSCARRRALEYAPVAASASLSPEQPRRSPQTRQRAPHRYAGPGRRGREAPAQCETVPAGGLWRAAARNRAHTSRRPDSPARAAAQSPERQARRPPRAVPDIHAFRECNRRAASARAARARTGLLRRKPFEGRRARKRSIEGSRGKRNPGNANLPIGVSFWFCLLALAFRSATPANQEIGVPRKPRDDSSAAASGGRGARTRSSPAPFPRGRNRTTSGCPARATGSRPDSTRAGEPLRA